MNTQRDVYCATSSTGYQCHSEYCSRWHLLPLTLSVARVPHTSITSVFRCLTSQVAPIFVRFGVVICSFPEQELCSADGVFELQRHSSTCRTVCLGICALWQSVMNNSELGWKLMFLSRHMQRTSKKFLLSELNNTLVAIVAITMHALKVAPIKCRAIV